MEQPDLETLVAYANGALPADRARQIERYVASNSEVQRVIESFRRRQGLSGPASQAPSRQARPPQAAPAQGVRSPRFEGTGGVTAPARKAGWFRKAAAVTACLVVIAGLGLGAFLLEQDAESPIAIGRLSNIDALSAALSRLASGGSGMAGDRVVTVLTTFRDATGRACRIFEMSDTSPTASRATAVACQDAGAWRIEGAAALMAGQSNSRGGLVLASSKSADPLAGLLNRLGAELALPHDEEAVLIAQNWQPEKSQ